MFDIYWILATGACPVDPFAGHSHMRLHSHLGRSWGLGYSGLYSNCKNGLANLVSWHCKIGVGYAYTLAKSQAKWGLMHSAMLMVSAVLRILTPNWGLPSPVGLVQSPCITDPSLLWFTLGLETDSQFC